MKALFGLVAGFAAAALLAVALRARDGFAVLVLPPWRVEMSLAAALLVVGVAFALVYAALRLVGHAVALPAEVRAWRARRARERGQAALAAALRAQMEGRHARAEQAAARAYEAGVEPSLAALLAARAAHELGAHERRRAWLERVEAGPFETARRLAQAEFALADRDPEAALAALEAAEAKGGRSVALLELRLRAARAAGHWETVLATAAALARRGALAPAAFEQARSQALIALFERAAGDAHAFEERWRRTPLEALGQAQVAKAAARAANSVGRADLAREALERALAKDWSAELLERYAELPAALDPEARRREALVRIERAEGWLGERPRDGALLAALGRLCAEAELWGKAERYLEAALSFASSPQIERALGQLAERRGDAAAAAGHYRSAAGA